ncbi:non-ribosomal peptide synthetase [Streptococcus macacae]|uniref:Linear gramicidin synthetase LgrD n=1 Tax=Streptococcus macacae NCTC 11558 TaxID=764298 RepID=G5JUF5_9STRE|nr:non-ribosomal peptide synthetase [Streptococcus macacae]EHJ52051.1 putative linear gramicidin synthetase LgrD [Streptococcus macacae NCTC 11558]SUN78597.1 putative non-ribosomal peptide sythetase [Streptococcus macacae NCTC 11558]
MNDENKKKQKLLNSILKGQIKKERVKEADRLEKTKSKEAPLSYAQKRMWFLHNLNEANDTYNMHSVLKMTGNLNKDALLYSLLKIVERHDILRTHFKRDQTGEPIQVVNDDFERTIEVKDMSTEDEGFITSYIRHEISKPFDLENDMLIRAVLIKGPSAECYYLVVTMHHIVSDGWSFAVLGQELMDYYKRYQKEDYSVDSLDYQYIDYTFWQDQYLASERLEHQCDYWKRQLLPLPAPLDLKVKHQEDLAAASEAGRHIVHIDQNQLSALKSLSTKTGTTLYMVLLTAYAILLNKYSFQEDFIIGTPVANRRRKELENLIGFFVNTLPIRIKLNTGETFEETLQKVKAETVDAFSNQDIPFEYIVKEVMGERANDQLPIMQTMFVLQNTNKVDVTLPNVKVENQVYENTTAKFDLLLTAMEVEQGVRLAFEYKKGLFDASVVESMANKYLMILDDILQNSRKSLLQIAHEEMAIVNQDSLFKDTMAFSSCNLIERFSEMVNENANKVAVSYQGQEISYAQLDKRSNQLSRYIDRFLQRDSGFVGLCMDRSIDMIVGILAILKSNCAYVPLDPDAPKERQDFIVKDAKLELLIGHKEKLAHIAVQDDIPLIAIDHQSKKIFEESAAPIKLTRKADSNAYMIYTSGSTGNPKGVIVSDNNVLRLFSNTEELYHFNNKDVWTMFHSVAFDFSVWEIWGALLYGGELVIVPYETSRTPDDFLKLLLDRKVTVLNQTPSAFRQLLQYDTVYSKETVGQIKLRYIIFGGEALDFKMLDLWIKAYGDDSPQLVNMYGITETTVHATYQILNKASIKDNRKSIIGTPIKDLQIYLLDPQMRLVPNGVIGEMYIGGAGVTKGYWNREKLSAERFIQNPFLNDTNSILYKTGDLACKYPNGDLEYIGRNDDQVKVKGFRIELNEIQEKVNQSAYVNDSLVILDKDDYDSRIISYFTLDKGKKKEIVQNLLLKNDYDKETQEVFNHHYLKDNTTGYDTFNITGWNNSYNNEQMTEAEMQEWLQSISRKLYEIPMRSVLEIGVGTGMILHKLSHKVKHYVGLDISKEAIDYNKRVIKKNGLNYDNVELLHTSVENLEKKVNNTFDTVIINSVAQYFPDVSYFEDTLAASIERIGDYGHIVIGDVRSYDRLDMYYLSVELSRLDKQASIASLRKNMAIRRENEKELIFAHDYFKLLKDKIPEIVNVDITPKIGEIDNELSKYRYDVILTIDKEQKDTPTPLHPTVVHWTDSTDMAQFLTDDMVHFVKVPDKRVSNEKLFIENLRSVNEQMTIENYMKSLAADNSLLSIEGKKRVEDLAKKKGYQVYTSVDNVLGYLDLIVYNPAIVEKKAIIQYLNNYYSCDSSKAKTTDPLKYKIQYTVIEHLKEALKDKLPYYMIPNEFLLIDHIPLTINGKIDYKALPKLNNSGNQLLTQKEDWCEDYVIETVTKVWENLLHLENISPKDNFFQLGGHSLLATNLIFSLNDIFNIRIPLKELFENPTILGNSKFIQSQLGIVHTQKKDTDNLEKDIQLPENFEIIKEKTREDLQHILITGATGFFGSFLVHRLLNDTSATVYCLVRAKDQQHARERLVKSLQDYKIYDPAYEQRIVAICGDLELPNLGMNEADYNLYSKTIDTVIHNGAKVNFFEPYKNLKKTNVKGTLNIIQFAALHRLKPIHFISTLYVYEPSQDPHSERLIDEDQPLGGYKNLPMGYTQSKWVSEKILELARNKGLPVNIYRLGRISGHSKTGACQQKDFIWSLVKGCIETGVYPNQNLTFELTPVDYLTDAVVQIIKSNELNTNYHLFNLKKISLQEIVQSISDSYDLKSTDMKQWINDISSAKSSARHFAQLLSDGTFNGGSLHFKNKHTSQHVPYFKNGIHINEAMLRAQKNYFIETQYFPVK